MFSILPLLPSSHFYILTSFLLQLLFKKPISTARLFCFMVWRRDLLPKRGACKLLRMLRLGELKVEMQVMKDDMKADIFYSKIHHWCETTENFSMMMMMMMVMVMVMVMMNEGISCSRGHVLGGLHTTSVCVLARF